MQGTTAYALKRLAGKEIEVPTVSTQPHTTARQTSRSEIAEMHPSSDAVKA